MRLFESVTQSDTVIEFSLPPLRSFISEPLTPADAYYRCGQEVLYMTENETSESARSLVSRLAKCGVLLAVLAGGCGGGGGSSGLGGITVSARAESASSIYLSWNRPVGNGSGSSFAIELSVDNGTTEIARTSLPSFTVRNLEPQTHYCFVVKYFTLIGSRSSNTACATTLADSRPPSVPSGLTATPVSPGEVDLSWNPATDDDRVEGYNVFRDGLLLTTTARTALERAAAIPGATHCYSVSGIEHRCRAVGSPRVGVGTGGEQRANLRRTRLLGSFEQLGVELGRARSAKRQNEERCNSADCGQRSQGHSPQSRRARAPVLFGLSCCGGRGPLEL
jgi:hypothetical protein